MTISACGLICDNCEHFLKTCNGCHQVEGKTFWAKEHFPGSICPLYDCSINKKGFKNCGNCQQLPCQEFNNLKDPSITEKEHLESISKRVELLKSLS